MRFVKIGRRYFFGWQGEKRRYSRGYIEAFQRSQGGKRASQHSQILRCQTITSLPYRGSPSWLTIKAVKVKASLVRTVVRTHCSSLVFSIPPSNHYCFDGEIGAKKKSRLAGLGFYLDSTGQNASAPHGLTIKEIAEKVKVAVVDSIHKVYVDAANKPLYSGPCKSSERNNS